MTVYKSFEIARSYAVQKVIGSSPISFMGAATPWIARYEDYANCIKDIARGYGNVPRSMTRALGGWGRWKVLNFLNLGKSVNSI